MGLGGFKAVASGSGPGPGSHERLRLRGELEPECGLGGSQGIHCLKLGQNWPTAENWKCMRLNPR